VDHAMQALEELSADALRLILDSLLRLWRPSQVLSNLLKRPDCFCDVWLHAQQALDMKNSEIPVNSLHRLIKKLPQNPNISVLHLPARAIETSEVFETLNLLNAVDAVLDLMPNSSVLGIHGLKLRPVRIPVLASILSILRGKLTGLSISLEDCKLDCFYGERCLLEAICKMRKLGMLAFPNMEDFLGSPAAKRTNFVHLLASAQPCTLFVRAESWRHFSGLVAMEPNLTILSAPFLMLTRRAKMALSKRSITTDVLKLFNSVPGQISTL
jgi:hypothetical protein